MHPLQIPSVRGGLSAMSDEPQHAKHMRCFVRRMWIPSNKQNTCCESKGVVSIEFLKTTATAATTTQTTSNLSTPAGQEKRGQ